LAWVYPLALALHLCLVIASVGLFAARALGVQLKHAWPMAPLWRRLSMGIDSGLLLAGASLWALLQLNPLRDHWLGVKLVLLLLYIGLGTLALKRARSQGAKAVCALAALATVGFMAGIALNHHPLGWWAPVA
jgi:uncharacterized membrane protein SirB2